MIVERGFVAAAERSEKDCSCLLVLETHKRTSTYRDGSRWSHDRATLGPGRHRFQCRRDVRHPRSRYCSSMPESFADEVPKSLTTAKERNVVFRSRAASVGTVMGAAAAALATFSVFPHELDPLRGLAKVMTLVAFIFFAIGTALLIAGSVYFDERPTGSGKKRGSKVGRQNRSGSTTPPRKTERVQELGDHAERVLVRIKSYMRWGQIAGVLGVLFVCLAGVASVAATLERNARYEVQLIAAIDLSKVCPDLLDTFEADIAERDLASGQDLLAVSVTATVCDSAADPSSLPVVVFLDRRDIAIRKWQ